MQKYVTLPSVNPCNSERGVTAYYSLLRYSRARETSSQYKSYIITLRGATTGGPPPSPPNSTVRARRSANRARPLMIPVGEAQFFNNPKRVLVWEKTFCSESQTGSLPADLEEKVKAFAKTFLDWAATLGGNYIGTLDLGIDDNDEVYWIECNVRATAFNCLPCLTSGDDFMTALTSDPSKYAVDYSDWKLTTIVSNINNDPRQEYPYALHA